LISRESELPASKDRLRGILLRAAEDSAYIHFGGGAALEVVRNALDTFVPEEEYEATGQLIERWMHAFSETDRDALQTLANSASPSQRAALECIVAGGLRAAMAARHARPGASDSGTAVERIDGNSPGKQPTRPARATPPLTAGRRLLFALLWLLGVTAACYG